MLGSRRNSKLILDVFDSSRLLGRTLGVGRYVTRRYGPCQSDDTGCRGHMDVAILRALVLVERSLTFAVIVVSFKAVAVPW